MIALLIILTCHKFQMRGLWPQIPILISVLYRLIFRFYFIIYYGYL